MHPKIIDAVDEKYRGGDSVAITRAKKAGTYELILVSLAQHDLLKQILDQLRTHIGNEKES